MEWLPLGIPYLCCAAVLTRATSREVVKEGRKTFHFNLEACILLPLRPFGHTLSAST